MFEGFSQRRVRHHLGRVHRELVAAREQIGVVTEQLGAFSEDADEARVRSVVTENTADVRSARHADGQRDLMARALSKAQQRVQQLEKLEWELLQQVRTE